MAIMVEILVTPLSRAVMAVLVKILVAPFRRAGLPVMPGRMVTPGPVPIPRLNRGRQQKNGGEGAADDGSFHGSPPRGDFFLFYLVRRKIGQSVNRVRLFR
jgi:hypothetical protein